MKLLFEAPVSAGRRLRFGRLGQGPSGERRLGRPFCAMGFEPGLSQWPPLRLAWLRCERGSVDVVCPPVLLVVVDSEEGLLPAYAAAGAVNPEADGNDAVVVSDHVTLRRERAGPRAVCRALDRDMAGDLVAGVGEGRARESGRRPLDPETTSLAVRVLATGAGAADGTG